MSNACKYSGPTPCPGAKADVADGLNDARAHALHGWAAAQLNAPMADTRLTVASADASFRRYFRLELAGQCWIAMDSPPVQEPLGDFLQMANWLESCEIPAPRVRAADPDQGFALISDLGQHTLLDVLTPDNADHLYQAALAWLAAMQIAGHCTPPRPPRPVYDRQRLMDEMALFPDWYLARHLQVTLPDRDREALHGAMCMLADDALAQPVVLVHRDYHSRNLMARPDGARLTGMLDFQDAVMGPVAYDAASLLKDCYIRWPVTDTARWRDVWASALVDAGMLPGDAPVQRWIDWVGLQRHLKVLGIFARLNHRDGKSRYLDDLPMVLDYVREVLERYPEFEPLARLFSDHVWPRV